MDLESTALSVCEADSPAVASLRYLQNAKGAILAAQDRVRSRRCPGTANNIRDNCPRTIGPASLLALHRRKLRLVSSANVSRACSSLANTTRPPSICLAGKTDPQSWPETFYWARQILTNSLRESEGSRQAKLTSSEVHPSSSS